MQSINVNIDRFDLQFQIKSNRKTFTGAIETFLKIQFTFNN